MITTVIAIAITAIVVGLTVARITQQTTTARLHHAISGGSGNDPVAEHQRLLVDATSVAAAATARSDLLQLSLDALTSGVIVTDHAGEVLVQNRTAGVVTNRQHERALVEGVVTELLEEAVRGVHVERELSVFGPPSRTLFMHAAPITADGATVGALAVIDDVTDHHRIEKTRRDFVANLSHELRTPVGAVSLLGEMLVDETDTEIRMQLADRLLAETDRMSATIDDLLELSRIESDTQNYDESVTIQSVVDEALARTRVVAEISEIEVGAVGPAEPIVMTANRDQLLTALVNLVENAIKYSNPGGSVSVRSRAEDNVVVLAVQDNGRGIPARDIDRIFERFYRVDRSRDSGTGGTGIGLSIVRHVALNHGGAVDVSSFEGEGSTFTITLPLATQPDTAGPSRQRAH